MLVSLKTSPRRMVATLRHRGAGEGKTSQEPRQDRGRGRARRKAGSRGAQISPGNGSERGGAGGTQPNFTPTPLTLFASRSIVLCDCKVFADSESLNLRAAAFAGQPAKNVLQT